MSTRRAGNTPVHSITSAAAPLGDDIAKRARRYLFQMGLRTLCFIGAVATWGIVPTWISVSLLVGAVILPYVAVVLANAGRERPERPDPFSEVVRQLGTSSAPDPGTPLDAQYGRSPFAQTPRDPAAFVQDPFVQDPIVQPGSGHGTTRPAGHPFDQAQSDRARSEQARFDDVFYDRVPFDTPPADRVPRTAPTADRPGREGAVENGPIRG